MYRRVQSVMPSGQNKKVTFSDVLEIKRGLLVTRGPRKPASGGAAATDVRFPDLDRPGTVDFTRVSVHAVMSRARTGFQG